MSILNHSQLAFLLCFGITLFGVASPVAFAQQDPEFDATINLDVDEIIGVADEDFVALSRLFNKATISELEFLNSGETPTSINQLKAMQEHVSSLYKLVEPAVVNIRSGMGQGSGVVVTSDGYILTAAHVISIPNRSAVITFPDGTRARAQTLGLFRTLDAGLLKIYEMIPSEEGEGQEDAGDEDSDDDEKSDSDDSKEESEDSDDEESEEDGDEDKDKDKDKDDEDEDEDEDEEEEDSEEEQEQPETNLFKVQDDLPSFDYLDIGDSADLKLGQWVIAVGHPGGLDEDRGIVLRVGRINKIAAKIDAANFQTDCTLVGGDSGGPLIGLDGSVLGIHSRIGMGLRDNFHVPSNDFINNWSAMLDPVIQDREPMTFIRFRGRTNVIERIPRNSITNLSGLKASDRIIRIGDKDIYDKLQFDDAVSELKPYQQVEFEVKRKGKKKIINVTIGEKPQRERR